MQLSIWVTPKLITGSTPLILRFKTRPMRDIPQDVYCTLVLSLTPYLHQIYREFQMLHMWLLIHEGDQTFQIRKSSSYVLYSSVVQLIFADLKRMFSGTPWLFALETVWHQYSLDSSYLATLGHLLNQTASVLIKLLTKVCSV